MKHAGLAVLLVACQRPPAMEWNPNVLWFRSRDTVSTPIARKIVSEAHRDGWAGPMYLMMPPAGRAHHLVGHQRILLREYETVSGRFRTVDPADDRAMGCVTVRLALESLEAWTRHYDVRWDAQLGSLRAHLPEHAQAIEAAACQDAPPADASTIRLRYADRPR
jgi:hypothetical protein